MSTKQGVGKPAEQVEMRSGELAARVGVGIDTLRFYERRGLLDPPRRTSGGHRVWTEADFVRLRAIRVGQRLGFTLGELRSMAGAPSVRSSRPGSVAALAQAKLTEIDERIRELMAVRTTLADALAAGCSDADDCLATLDCPAMQLATLIAIAEPAEEWLTSAQT